MKFVVSANYRDRNSAYKWLVRRAEDPIESAVAVESLELRGVQFRESNKAEQGFGCSTVAFCEEVYLYGVYTNTDGPRPLWLDYKPTAIENALLHADSESLAFNGLNICRAIPLKGVSQLSLSSAGTMNAVGLTEH